MSSEKLLLTVASESVIIFNKLHDGSVLSCGSSTASTRAAGAAGDSVVIDCAKTKTRIGLVAFDSRPDEFAIAVSNREDPAADVEYVVLPMAELNTSNVLKYMDAHFAK